ncbi:hypothetical protein C0J52_06418 [Blattella germanica]|nr:hypothetical protein C0J52_06418 [Blattella germanica]
MEPDLEYTALCSSKTLQSQDQGFFLAFAEQVTESVGRKWIKDKFSHLRSDEERIRVCAGLGDCVTGVLQNVQALYRRKDDKVSTMKRDEGDRYITAGNPQRALFLYNHAVVRASSGLCLAMALAARSEALLQVDEFEPCLADIQLAIREGFPQHLRYQLYWRMGRCYRGMGHIPKARVSLQLAITLLSENKDQIGPMEMIATSTRMHNELSQLDMETSIPKIEAPPSTAPILPSLSQGPNAAMPAASRLVKVLSSKEQGRYTVATDHINTGDTVVVEKPYAACLLPDMFGTHCHHCFKRLLAPITCSDCSGVAFCSVACRDTACRTYHQYECHHMDLLVGSGMSILCHLALRMITQNSLQHFKDIKDSLQESFMEFSSKPGYYFINFIIRMILSIYSTGSYASIYNLVTHADRRPAEDFLHRTLMALFLLRCLQDTDFFPDNSKSSDSLNQDEIYIGSLLLRHLQLLQFNAHEIFETCMEAPNKFRGSKTLYVGVGIYPTVAMFNHDCQPALARYFVGKNIVLRALRPLEPGESVAENYGPIFTKRPISFRQRTLTSRYWFQCACRACKEDWPTYDTLSNDSFRLRCPTKGCTQLSKKGHKHCPKCKKQVTLQEGILEDMAGRFSRGMDEMDAGDIEQATKTFCQYLDTMYRVGAPPCRDMSLCQDALRGCLSVQGNIWIVK